MSLGICRISMTDFGENNFSSNYRIRYLSENIKKSAANHC